jgi:hypothetical protein
MWKGGRRGLATRTGHGGRQVPTETYRPRPGRRRQPKRGWARTSGPSARPPCCADALPCADDSWRDSPRSAIQMWPGVTSPRQPASHSAFPPLLFRAVDKRVARCLREASLSLGTCRLVNQTASVVPRSYLVHARRRHLVGDARYGRRNPSAANAPCPARVLQGTSD